MKKTFGLFLSLLLALGLLLTPAIAGADFGDYSSDSDYGSWDSGSDWGSSDWDSSGWDSDQDSGGAIYIGDLGGGSLFAVLLVIIILTILFKGKKNRGRSAAPMPGGTRTAASALKPISAYKALDEGFDPAALEQRISNLYVQMQNAWQVKDIASLRPYFTDGLFAQMERQLNAMKAAGRTNYIERIAVLSSTLKGFYQQGGNDCMVASLRTRITDYTLEDATGKLVKGSRDKELFMEYEWTLVRPSGKKTAQAEDTKSVLCPHCGAPLNINETAKCPYCGSIITVEDHGWALSAIKGIAQRSSL